MGEYSDLLPRNPESSFCYYWLHCTCLPLCSRVKKGEDLVKPMLTGDKTLTFQAQDARDQPRDRLMATSILVACIAIVGASSTWLG